MVSSGDIYEHAPSATDKTEFKSVVHVGHSFGSFLSNALITVHPELSDAAILTGFIPMSHQNILLTAFGPDFARTNDPERFGDRPDGYFVPALDIDVQTQFLSQERNGKGGFAPELLVLANDTKQPATTGGNESTQPTVEVQPQADRAT